MARKGIFFPIKDAALRDDVHALGQLVGEVIRDQCGEEIFNAVEGDRQAAIGRRQGDAEDCVQLVVRTQGRPPTEARELIRAFSAWFQMVNTAEKVHRVRRRRQYMNDSSTPQPGGLEECFARLRSRGLSLQQVEALLGQVSIEPVFTAHPTESTRRTLLRQQQRIARLLIDRLDPSQTPGERHATVERVRTELTTGWQTADNSRERLTVADEREHVLFFLVEVIYEVIPGVLRRDRGCAGQGLRRRRGRTARAGDAALRLLGGRGHGRPPRRARQDHPRELPAAPPADRQPLFPGGAGPGARS